MQNALLLQLLASRYGGAGQANIAEAIARLQGGNGSAPAPSMQELIAQLSQRNPAVAKLAEQMKWGEAPAAEDQSVIDVQTVDAETPDSRFDYEPPPPSMQLLALQAEVEELREKVDRCAAALGACGVCWGTLPGCRACRGRGRPGFALPDETLFAELIVPAIHTLKMHRVNAPSPVQPT